MKIKLAKKGKKLSVAIDELILDSLGLTEKTEFSVGTDGKNIILKPVLPKKSKLTIDEKRQKKIYKEIIKKYSPALKKLAQS